MDVKKLEAALDELLKDYRNPEEITGPGGLLKQLTKSLLERAMAAELTHHIGYEKHRPRRGNEAEAADEAGEGSQSRAPGKANSRNGTSRKRVKGDFGEVEIEVPRDRTGSFEPRILPKHQRRFTGFDDKILSMYARGMTTREIQGHLEEIYGVEVSPSLVSEVTEAVMEEARTWQSRPLEPIYPILYLDALMVKMRHEGRVASALRAVYSAAAESEAQRQLAIFDDHWGGKYAPIGQLWRRQWERVRPLFEFPAPIRKVIYTTNAVESLNMTLRKVIKTRGAFPSEDAAIKLLYLALRNVAKNWQHIQGWREALNHFTLLWGERIEEALARGR